MSRARTVGVVFCTGLLLADCRKNVRREPVVLLTTPAIAATSLAPHLAGSFQRQTSVPVEVRVVTKEQMLAAAEARSGVVLLFHDPALDAALSQRGLVGLRTVFAVEDYFILGPPNDPARIGHAPAAAEAFRRVLAAGRTFCSPVDVPILHNAEHEIWSAAQIDPTANRRYRFCHGDAAEVLAISARLRAYTLTDRLTAQRSRMRNLKVLLRDLPALHSAYVMLLTQSSHPLKGRGAEWFLQWLMSYRGREIIEALRGPDLPRLALPDQR